MRVALQCGLPHPDFLLAAVTQRQLLDIGAYNQIEPIGAPAEDYRAAMLAWATALGKTGRKKFKITDFIPQWGPREAFDASAYKAKAKAVYAAATGRLKPN